MINEEGLREEKEKENGKEKERKEKQSLDLCRVRRHFQKSQADRQMNRLKLLKRPLN